MHLAVATEFFENTLPLPITDGVTSF